MPVLLLVRTRTVEGEMTNWSAKSRGAIGNRAQSTTAIHCWGKYAKMMREVQ